MSADPSSFTWRGVEMQQEGDGRFYGTHGQLRIWVTAYVARRWSAVINVNAFRPYATFDCRGAADTPTAALDAAAANLEELVRGMPPRDGT